MLGKPTNPLQLVAARDDSQARLMQDVQGELDRGDVRYIVVLLETDDGESGFYASAISKAQIVYMLEEAKHSAICMDDDDNEPGPLVS